MKSFLLFAAILFTLYSCNEAEKEQEVIVEKIESEIPEEDTFPYDTLQGMYMADFGGSTIRIILNYVSGKNAIGYNIHKGLQRNITGNVTRSGDSIQVILNEPGDNKYDGVFTLDFIGIDKTPNGNWTANDPKIPSQNFTMKKIDPNSKVNNDEITIYNFADIFSTVSDSIGEYYFEKDGLVTLRYYEDKDIDWDKQQYKEIKGSWELKGQKAIINWEPNPIYKTNRLELDILKDEYGEPSLRENGNHELYMMWY